MASAGWARRLAGLALCAAAAVSAQTPAPAGPNPALEQRVYALSAELRCLVCQNQTIADSHADLAVDLRRQIRTMLAEGRSEAQVRDYMTDRYGDFVLYRPPFKATTALLWAAPALLVVGALAALAISLRRRSRLGAEAFEPDPTDADDPPAPR